jgi:hypothetical protein
VGSAGELIKLKNKYHTLHDKLLEKKPKLEKLGKYLIYTTYYLILIKIIFNIEKSQDDNIKILILKWNKVFDGVQLIRNRLQQDVQLHSEFKGLHLLIPF